MHIIKPGPQGQEGNPGFCLYVQYSNTRMVKRKEIIDFITNNWLSGVVKKVCK